METAHWLRTRRRRFFVIPISGKSYCHCKLISCVCSTGMELPASAFISQLTLVLNKLSNTEKSMFSRQLKTLGDIDLNWSKIWWELIKFFIPAIHIFLISPAFWKLQTEYKYCYDLVLHYVLHYLHRDGSKKWKTCVCYFSFSIGCVSLPKFMRCLSHSSLPP